METTMNERESIISKIRKLLAMTEDRGATPHEAAIAAAKVQALLTEHNLEMADVSKVETVDEIGRDTQDITKSVRSPYRKPLANLLHICAEYNYCKAVYSFGTGKTVIFGKAHNIEVVKYLYTYLSRTLMAEAKQQHHDSGTAQSVVTWTVGFLEGARKEIAYRLKTQQEEQAAINTAVNALVVVSRQFVEQRAAQEFPHTKKMANGRVRSVDAFLAGQVFGKNVALNQAVNSPKQFTQIGG